FKDFSNLTVSGLDITGYDTANWSAELDGLGWLHFAAIPEPSTWALTVTGLLMIALMMRILPSKTADKNNK
ncbi:MAG: PEP-CTERM sorting domain-containing protein, partial [Verrucomicrobiales bacterium]|nr:PEP-CTERM sorting domain-containing protein [Verrucomicrobiales bacterium]